MVAEAVTNICYCRERAPTGAVNDCKGAIILESPLTADNSYSDRAYRQAKPGVKSSRPRNCIIVFHVTLQDRMSTIRHCCTALNADALGEECGPKRSLKPRDILVSQSWIHTIITLYRNRVVHSFK